MNSDLIVDSLLKGMRQGLKAIPEDALVKMVDEVSEYSEVSDETLDLMMRASVKAMVVKAIRDEVDRRVLMA